MEQEEKFVLGNLYELDKTIIEEEKEGVIVEFSSVDLGNNCRDCIVKVRGNEDMIPHFHIIKDGGEFNCCVCLFENKYFTHGTKRDTLKSSNTKELDKWLRKKSSKQYNGNKELTNWEYLVVWWKQADNPLNLWKNYTEASQPNYTSITEFKNPII